MSSQLQAMRVKKLIEVECEYKGLGERIRQARQADPRSLARICKETGISSSYWYQLEAEKVYGAASLEIIRKIEAALGVDLEVDL